MPLAYILPRIITRHRSSCQQPCSLAFIFRVFRSNSKKPRSTKISSTNPDQASANPNQTEQGWIPQKLRKPALMSESK
jgi:hypothetical protein